MDTGKDIIMTGWAGLNGSAILADKYYDSLTSKLPKSVIDRVKILAGDCDIKMAERTADTFGARYFRVSEGGIYKALRDIPMDINEGMEVYLSQISIRQETIEICEYFDLNPYMLNSEGSLLIISEKGNMLVRKLNKSGVKAGIIGYTCKGNGRVVINGDIKSYIQSRIKDELFRLNL